MEKGVLFGVGTGPGDAGMITKRALQVIRECEYIAVTTAVKEKSKSYQTALLAVPGLDEKECLCLAMPMTKDEDELEKSRVKAEEALRGVLDEGKSVAFLTLGDPSIYSTYAYMHERMKRKGYRVEMISGVPAFCASAALAGRALALGGGQLHILSFESGVEESLEMPGTKVLMKAGGHLSEIKALLRKKGLSAVMVQNCGMENEKVYESVDEMPDKAGYYSTVIIYD